MCTSSLHPEIESSKGIHKVDQYLEHHITSEWSSIKDNEQPKPRHHADTRSIADSSVVRFRAKANSEEKATEDRHFKPNIICREFMNKVANYVVSNFKDGGDI